MGENRLECVFTKQNNYGWIIPHKWAIFSRSQEPLPNKWSVSFWSRWGGKVGWSSRRYYYNQVFAQPFFLKFHRHYVWVFFIKVWISWCWKSWKHLTFTCTCIRESYITCTCIKVQIRYRSYFVKDWPFTWCVCLHVRKLHKY